MNFSIYKYINVNRYIIIFIVVFFFSLYNYIVIQIFNFNSNLRKIQTPQIKNDFDFSNGFSMSSCYFIPQQHSVSKKIELRETK